MILLLNTSTPTCKLTLINGDRKNQSEWLADRDLSNGLHRFIKKQLSEYDASWQDIKGIGVFRGPGSFTGLRIGLSVMNTLADSLNVPIVGTIGLDWQNQAIAMLEKNINDEVVQPLYGSEANITKPRK